VASNWIIGTGLGLPVTKKLVEGMNGKIEVKSELGLGSEFTVSIPFKIAVGKYLKNDSTATDESLPAGIRILVADDTNMNVLLLKTIFKRVNVEISTAENGVEALKLLDENEYSLVLTDVHMPVMDGIELTKRIRNHHNQKLRNLPVIILTGSISQEATERMKDAGVNDCLYKPFKQKDLFEMIRKNLLNS
jgi:CheY-like chemotaxis protein